MKEVMVSYGADVHDCKQTQNTVSCILSDSVKNFCYFIFVFPHQELQERSTITQSLPSCKHTLSMQVLEGYCTWLCVLLCVGVSVC